MKDGITLDEFYNLKCGDKIILSKEAIESYMREYEVDGNMCDFGDTIVTVGGIEEFNEPYTYDGDFFGAAVHIQEDGGIWYWYYGQGFFKEIIPEKEIITKDLSELF